MDNKVLQTIKKYNLINENDSIVIGVSGGPDSVCLFHILNDLKTKLNFKIVVAHLNHMIRKEADEETEYVEKLCSNYNVPCYTKKVDILEKANSEKKSTEEAGREERYAFFEEVLKKVGANKIATAHNANDNAETILMNIFRGTGISGLKGIEPIRDGIFIRPLIECERVEIEEYCERYSLEPKIDKSNFENVYTRNKIRNILIPEIKENFNPNIIEGLGRLSMLVRQENDFINRYVYNIMQNDLIISKNYNKPEESNSESNLTMDLKKFNKLDIFVKGKVVLAAIHEIIGTTQGIEKVHVDDIIKLCSRNIGNKYLTPNKHIKVYVNGGVIHFIKMS